MEEYRVPIELSIVGTCSFFEHLPLDPRPLPDAEKQDFLADFTVTAGEFAFRAMSPVRYTG